VMLSSNLSSWLYIKPTGDPGYDRNARTVQFACLILVTAVSAVLIMNAIDWDPRPMPLLIFALVSLNVALAMNRTGRWKWAARTTLLVLLVTAMLLVFQARDGLRSQAMLVFPAMLRNGIEFWIALAAGCALTIVLYLITFWLLPRAGINV